MDQQDQVQRSASDWWPQADMPVRAGCVVEPLIDGRAAMFAMCKAFLTAKDYILLAAWDICTQLPMVRGDDTRLLGEAVTDDTTIQERLRAEGFDDETIAFWKASQLRVIDVLGFVAKRGVKVGVLLW